MLYIIIYISHTCNSGVTTICIITFCVKKSYYTLRWKVITFLVNSFITFCVDVITFCVSITFCGDC